MRTTWLVTYDVCDPKRLRRVYRTLLGYGYAVQLSVFRCELTDREHIECRAALAKIIHHREDQLLFVDVGPSDGRGRTAIGALGRKYTPSERAPVIV
jgi:CRISPR-associated protein Cas2